MSMHPQPITPVPEETARVAHAAFPKGNLYMKMRDELGIIYQDQQFASLFPSRGKPAEAPWRLALICVFQFIEGLSDRQAADAVRSRIDWKYALGQELTDSGFDFSVFSEFRVRLITGGVEQQLLDTMLVQFKQRGWLKERGAQRTDSTHVLAAVRVLNRLETVGETLRAALNALAASAPDWLRQQVDPEWFERAPASLMPADRGVSTAKRPRSTVRLCSHNWRGRLSSAECSLLSPSTWLAARNPGSAGAAPRVATTIYGYGGTNPIALGSRLASCWCSHRVSL